MKFEQYKELNEKILAKDSLQKRVIKEIEEEKMKPKKLFKGFSRVAAIFIAVALLSITAYAATRGFGITDIIKIKNADGAEKLSTEGGEAYKGKYGSYKVHEYIFDGNVMYVCIEITSLKDDVLLIPFGLAYNDEARREYNGRIHGIEDAPPGQTIEEYAKAHGKEIVHADFEFYAKENGSDKQGVDLMDWRCPDIESKDDKTTYMYFTFDNPFENNENVNIQCVVLELAGEWVRDELTDEDKVKFDINVENKGNIESKTYIKFDEKVNKDTGVTMNSLKITETEIGTYLTFNYTPTEEMKKVKDPNKEQDYLDIVIIDKNGDELWDTDFNYWGGIKRNSDGTHSYTVGANKLESLDGLQFKCLYRLEEYGPYPLPTE